MDAAPLTLRAWSLQGDIKLTLRRGNQETSPRKDTKQRIAMHGRPPAHNLFADLSL